MELLDINHTDIGKKMLLEILKNYDINIYIIKERQYIIKYLVNNNNIYSKIDEVLLKCKDYEKNYKWIKNIDYSSKEIETLLKQVYFKYNILNNQKLLDYTNNYLIYGAQVFVYFHQ